MATDKKVTTKKDFDVFCKAASSWLEIFGLKEWDVEFFHGDTIEDDDARAWCRYSVKYKRAAIFLAVNWQDSCDIINDTNIKKSALHEVLHLLFADLDYAARTRYITDEEYFTHLVHVIIRRFESVFYNTTIFPIK